MAYCPLCTEGLPPDADWCPRCQRHVPKDLFDLPASTPVPTIPDRESGVAIYTLETAARCPHCQELVRTVRVLRMHRTQAAFTSALPRGGRAIVCPECERILSIELAVLA